MPIENITQWTDQLNAANDLQREETALAIEAALAILNTSRQNAQQVASDARRVTALAFIASDVTPLLTDPATGDYDSQHAQLLNNIDIVQGFVPGAPDAETRQELNNTKQAEQDKLTTLKQLHAQGGIT